MKSTYKKILKAIMAGKTVVLDVSHPNWGDHRLRVLTKKRCFFSRYDSTHIEMEISCFSRDWDLFRYVNLEGKDLIKSMEQYDKGVGLKIKRIHVMK